jgi:hypothetical protein
MKQLVAALSVALVVALFVAGQSTSKKLTVVSFKSPPVEILRIKLNGKILKPNDSFTPTSDWTSNLEVTVKNVSEQPVSCVQVLLYSDKVDAAEVMTFNTDFTFGAPKSDVPVFIQPNETVVLSHTWTYGDIFDFSSASIVVQYVYWNNDETTYWGAGRILHKGQDGNYYAEPRPSAKYTLPKNIPATN